MKDKKNALLRLNISLCLIALFWLLGPISALADTIKLKDGSVYKGKVTGYSQRKFTIVIYVGSSSSQHVIPVDEIESVEFDANDTGAPRAGSPVTNTDSSAARSEKLRTETPRDTQPNLRASEPPTPLPKNTATKVPASGEVSDNESRSPGAGEPAGLVAEKEVKVAAAADWTSTEIRVQRGQRVAVTASGEVELGNNQRSGPNGITLNDSRKLLLSSPTGALIAVVGDDNDDFVFVGVGGEFVATHSGVLFLSVNEGNLKDNNGSFSAKVKVFNK